MHEARRAFWKAEFERCWRNGDKAGMVAAEEMLEAYAAYEAMVIEERMRQQREQEA